MIYGYFTNTVGTLETIPWVYLDYCSVAFVLVNPDGSLYPYINHGGSLQTIINVVAASHTAGKKVTVSIQWGDPEAPWFNSSSFRSSLIANALQMVETYNLDGINLDFESGNAVTAGELIIPELYNQLNARGKTLDCYVGGNPITLSVSMEPYLDAIFVNGYDLRIPDHAAYDLIVDRIENSITKGFHPNKLVMCYPSYAYDNEKPACTYRTIVETFTPAHSINQLTGVSTVTDFNDITQPVNGGILWWNGYDLAVQKAQYAKNRGLKGLCLWTVDMDAIGNDSLLKAVVLPPTQGKIIITTNPTPANIKVIKRT